MRAFLVSLAVLALAGCVTPYQPMAWNGGFEETKTAPGEYVVRVAVTQHTHVFTAEKYFHRRAAELCSADGFTGYDHDLQVGASTTTEAAQFRTTRDSAGNTTTTQTGGGTDVHPWVRGTVKCKGAVNAADGK